MSISIPNLLRATIDQLVGLVVDDGFVAVGAVVALALTGWFAALGDELVATEALGVLLFAIVSIVLLASLVRAGIGARAHAVAEAAQPGTPMAGRGAREAD